MQEMSVFWLRAAVALYAVGLFHTVQVALRKGASIFRPALIAFSIAVVLHMVALVEAGRLARHFPPEGFHNSVSLCAFLIGVLFLFVYWRYRFESLGVFLFPMVFVMTAVASLQAPTPHWTNSSSRSTWLVVHIVLVLLGYAALVSYCARIRLLPHSGAPAQAQEIDGACWSVCLRSERSTT